MKQSQSQTGSPYEFYGKIPLRQAIPLGLQHVLAMFVGNLTPILIISPGHSASECHADRRYRHAGTAFCHWSGGR